MNNPVKILIEKKLKSKHPFSIFFMGLSKNAGKTTALNYFRSQLQQMTTRPLVLLSTGYDGEDTDAISGLVKPKITMSPGNLFVTSEDVIQLKSEECRIVDSWTSQTPFGKVMLAEALADTTFPLITAGCNEEIKYIIEQVKNKFEDPIFLVDGSINRKAFLTLGSPEDIVILSIGATLSNKMDELVNELSYNTALFQLPVKKEYDNNYFVLETIDQSKAEGYKNTKVIIPGIGACFLSALQFKKFLAAGNELYYITPSPVLSLITFNPFNPTGKDLNSNTSLFFLQKSIPDIQITNIRELSAC